MKLLVDFFPILLFFVAYKLQGIYVATGVAIAASAAQVGWGWWRRGKVETMHLATLVLLVVFGGLTIALRDPIFVMWKPTLVNWLFAAVFLGSQWVGERTLIERLMAHAIEVPRAIWQRLNLAWVLFFVFSGLANLYVVYFWSGFFEAREALIAATGQEGVDLADCAERFSGAVLGLCTDAHAREEVWVNFKLFGMMGLTILFVIAQAFYLARHIKDEPQPAETAETD
jgi:intracellular septation protein